MIDPNKQYRTRDGRPVRIYAVDGHNAAPIHGAYKSRYRIGWRICAWDWDGNPKYDGPLDRLELIEATLADELTEQIPWEALHPDIQWVALQPPCDRTDLWRWLGFTEKPIMGRGLSYNPQTAFSLVAVKMPEPDVDRWQETLCKRPEGR